MQNAVKFSVHAKSVTGLDMILPIQPSAINQSLMKNTDRLTHSSHGLMQPYNPKPYGNKCIQMLEAQLHLPLASKLDNIKYSLCGSLSSSIHVSFSQ